MGAGANDRGFGQIGRITLEAKLQTFLDGQWGAIGGF